MLDLFRRNANNILGMGLVVVISVVFIFNFGIQQSGWGQGASSISACSVYGEDIPESSFRLLFILNGGKSIPIENQVKMNLRETTMEGLIERELLIFESNRLGLSIGEDDIDDHLINGQIFASKPIGNIVQKYYNYRIVNNEIDPDSYFRSAFVDFMDFRKNNVFQYNDFRSFVLHHLESNMKAFKHDQGKELLAHRIRQLIMSNVRLDEDEAYDYFEKANLKLDLSYMIFSPNYFKWDIDFSSNELSQWANTNKDRILQFYNTNSYQFLNLDRQAKVLQILFKKRPVSSDNHLPSSQSNVSRVVSSLNRGIDFEFLAKKYSEDKQSSRRGGSLGWISKGRLPAKLEEVIFSMNPGEISEPIETDLGIHIVKLMSFREGDISLDDAEMEIAEKLYLEEKSSELARSKAIEALQLLKSGTPFDSIYPYEKDDKDPYAPKAQKTSSLGRNGSYISGIGEDSHLADIVFSLTSDIPFPNEPIKVGDEYFVIRLNNRTDPDRNKFNQVRDKLMSQLLSEKKFDAVSSFVGALISRASDSGAISRNLKLLNYPAQSASSGDVADHPNELNPKATAFPQGSLADASADDESY